MKLTKPITKRQRQILNYFLKYLCKNMKSPSLRIIANHFGISMTAVNCIISYLVKKQYLDLIQEKGENNFYHPSIKTITEYGLLFGFKSNFHKKIAEVRKENLMLRERLKSNEN